MSREELDALLAQEIRRRLALIGSGEADPRDLRAALHTLKGSAAMAGHGDLALVIAQLSARVRGGEAGAAGAAGRMLTEVAARLDEGKPPFATVWPEPPPGLGPSTVNPAFRAEYLAAVRERFEELSAVADEDPTRAGVERAIRTLHSIKGTAAAVGDDLTAWYCHGLEASLKRPGVEPRVTLAELARHGSLLATMVEDGAGALEILRGSSGQAPPPSAHNSAPPPATRRPSVQPEDDTGEHTVRVQGVSLERVLERVELIRLAHDEVAGASSATERESARLGELRRTLIEALRLLGPPRPWGPPAKALVSIEGVAHALGATAEDLARGSALGRRGAERMRAAAEDVRREIGLVRRTTLSAVLTRVGAAAERLAEREGRDVRVVISATDAPVEREVAERLVDPLMQLARNALAHGIEPTSERAARGKSPTGTLRLSGSKIGNFLHIVCEDDGRGVDIESVRSSAIASGSISTEAARGASDDELLSLLFVPGLTTKREADLLAGRGVGLDLALNTVRRLGGTIRLERIPGSGLRATLELPIERWTTDVLWLNAGAWNVALPVNFSGRLSRVDPKKPPVHLLACLGEEAPNPPRLSLELSLRGIPTVSVGIDAVGEVEECSLRPLPTLLSQSGPFSGAILRGDGSLLLALDAALLAVRAWALG